MGRRRDREFPDPSSEGERMNGPHEGVAGAPSSRANDDVSYPATGPGFDRRPAIRLTILGEPASKANSRRVVKRRHRVAVIKSPKALDYEAAALLQIPVEARAMFEGPVRVTMRIYYATQRPDLDESVILDVLQARFTKGEPRQLIRAGVYTNDRQVREKHIYHGIDRDNPRAEIEVEELAA